MINLEQAFQHVQEEFRAGRYIAAWAHIDIIVANTKMPYTGIVNLYQTWLDANKNQVNA